MSIRVSVVVACAAARSRRVLVLSTPVLGALLTVVSFGALAGCGSAGSGGASASPPAAGTLGTRALPGYAVTVQVTEPVVAGSEQQLRLVVTPDQGLAEPVGVVAALAATEPPTWVSATVSPTQAHAWTVVVLAPAGLTEARVWVQVIDVDGNRAQSGSSDFPLAP